MSFTWPAALLLALAVPLVLGTYLLAARRRRRQAVKYSSLALLRRALPRRSRWRRHIPVALLLAGLAVLAVAAARPQLTSDVPAAKTTIILALDQSGSMCLSDVLPNRLTVAQDAAREFVNAQPKGTQMGLVLFAGYAELAVPPTSDRKALDQALDNLSTSPGTAIGAAILKALDAISEVDPQVAPIGNAVSSAALTPSGAAEVPGGAGSPAGATNAASGPAPKPPKDGYVPDIIVLLTDGENNRGITPLQAVPYAVARRVRVYTIGFGTNHVAPFSCNPQQQGGFASNGGFGPTGGFGGGGYGGGRYGGGGFNIPGGGSPLVADLPPSKRSPGSPAPPASRPRTPPSSTRCSPICRRRSPSKRSTTRSARLSPSSERFSPSPLSGRRSCGAPTRKRPYWPQGEVFGTYWRPMGATAR